ncbi:MAG: sensor histidine kinase [Rhodanobacter sp.]
MNLPRPSILLLATVILWTVAYAAWTAGSMLEPTPFALERALRRIPECVIGALLCLGIGRVLTGMRGKPARRIAVVAIAAVLGATVVHACVNELAFYVIAPRWGDAKWEDIPGVVMSDFWVFAAWVLLYFALAADAARRDREVHLARASEQATDARHQLLVQQINPHFLFNALNTVYALVLENDNARARRSLLALSSFLRRSLESGAPLNVPLSRELASVRDYLEIEMTRFGERLRLVEEVPTALLDRIVPNLILQPLVENCVKHGLRDHADAVTIALSAAAEGDAMILCVENDGPVAGESVRHGVGLDHVAQRLRLLYGDRGGMEAGPRPGGGYVVRIRLPGA